MDKFAQKRDWKDWIREKVNLPGAAVEKFFKPELDRIMNDLRLKDDNIRSILVGQKVGDSNVNVDGRPIKDLLKSAHSNFNRRAYLPGVADLGEFHKKLFQVTQYIKELDLNVNKIHHRFLFQDLDPKQKDSIEGLRDYMSKSSEILSEEYFIKEAGLMDFFYNLHGSGRARAIWEKRYPKVAKDLREGGSKLLDMADSILSDTLSYLKIMATARATRNVDEYMEAARKIQSLYIKFDAGDKGFKAFYNNVVKKYIDTQAEIEKQEAATKSPAVITPGTTSTNITDTEPSVPPMGGGFVSVSPQAAPNLPLSGPPGASPPFTPPLSSETVVTSPEENAPPTERDPNPPVHVKTHHRFYEFLESLSKEDPRILANYISKYAISIQETDPETAIKLFKTVKNIRE